jgi:hypothetical protein
MSNACIKCVRKIEHDVETCAQNVTCSAKAMEALGSSKITNRLCERGDCFVSEYVGDDDSSTKTVMRHSYAGLLREGKLDEWPRYEGADTKKRTQKTRHWTVANIAPGNYVSGGQEPQDTPDSENNLLSLQAKKEGLCW